MKRSVTKAAVLYYYRQFRDHGYTAEAALQAARSHLYFRERLTASVAEHKRRSRAAKKAWKIRKAKGSRT